MRWWLPLLFIPAAFAECWDLSGEWRNTKGSNLIIEQVKHQIHGTFSTAVEVKQGSSGNGAMHIRGWVYNEMISFTVKYSSSMAAFTGQCYEKNGNDTIHVSWLLHSRQDSCDDHWLATRVGQDKFVRVKPKNRQNLRNEDM